jgi:hypothetical protein
MRNKYQTLFYQFTFPLLVLLLFCAVSEAQSGGQFRIEQSVIAGGGNTAQTGGQFSLGGTTGQSVAGQTASNSPFSDHAGFWLPVQFVPTAAQVSISGKVITIEGQGIRNVQIILTGNNVVRTAQTTSFGNFRFDEVEIGQTYILQIVSKRFVFTNPTRILNVQEDIADANFIADPQ